MDLRLLLQQQGLSVRQLAFVLEVPLKTVQDWVYRGVVPSPANQAKLDEVVVCKHHWVIETAAGPVSIGTCRLCGEEREFNNSIGFTASLWATRPPVYPKGPQSEVESDGLTGQIVEKS